MPTPLFLRVMRSVNGRDDMHFQNILDIGQFPQRGNDRLPRLPPLGTPLLVEHPPILAFVGALKWCKTARIPLFCLWRTPKRGKIGVSIKAYLFAFTLPFLYNCG
jgi:hypothetical protein